MSASFERLMAPGRIGALELRNRILMCPMGDSIAEDDGQVSDRQIAYYGARARGGAALLIVGSVGVAYPAGSYAARQTAASDDRYVPGLARLADEVHRHGGKLAAQLVHDAANSRFDIQHGRPLLVSSPPKPASPDRLTMMVTPGEAQAMMAPFTQPTSKLSFQVATESDIAQAIEWFADAAERVVTAGFDAIELHAGHGYLIDWFLSPAKNQRTDGWGRDVEGRSRFLCEIIRAVRARVGPEVPVWMRFNAEEPHTDGGTRLEDAIEVLAYAERAGIDAVHVSAYGNPMAGVGITDSHTPHTPGNLVRLAAAIKAVTTLPVITFGRLEPEAAEAVLAAGSADFISMGRKLLADPDLPNKLAAGRPDDIRPCIYQYRCIGNIFVLDGVACVSNSATANGDVDAPPPATRPRHVVVAGGGAAGLETARLLAAAGHRVTLCEAGTELGGRLLVAGVCDPVLERMRGWLIRQVEQAGVALVLGQAVTAELLAALGADEVVDATGTAWPGLDPVEPWIRDEGTTPTVGARVVITGGDKPGLSLADLLVRRGRDVTVVEPSGVFGQAIGLPGRFRLVHDLETAGATLVTELSERDQHTGVDTSIDTRIDMARAAPVPLSIAGVAHSRGRRCVRGGRVGSGIPPGAGARRAAEPLRARAGGRRHTGTAARSTPGRLDDVSCRTAPVDERVISADRTHVTGITGILRGRRAHRGWSHTRVDIPSGQPSDGRSPYRAAAFGASQRTHRDVRSTGLVRGPGGRWRWRLSGSRAATRSVRGRDMRGSRHLRSRRRG